MDSEPRQAFKIEFSFTKRTQRLKDGVLKTAQHQCYIKI